MALRVAQYRFRPGWVTTLVTLLLLPLLISLGSWQLNRAGEKRQLQSELEQRLTAPTERVVQAARLTDQWRFRKVLVSGYFMAERQYLLDNQIAQGRVGYQVFTPLELAHGGGCLLVNRGWIALGVDRTQLPALPVDGGMQELSGVLSEPPGELLQLAEPRGATPRWPQVVQHIDLTRIAAALDCTLPRLVLQLGAEHPDALVPIWRPYVDTPQKHVSYAVQWFAMAAIVLILYILLNTRRIPRPESG